MIPKEKAQELISLEVSAQYPSDLVDGIRIFLAKRNALIFAKLKINALDFNDNYELYQFWNEVVYEIENFY